MMILWPILIGLQVLTIKPQLTQISQLRQEQGKWKGCRGQKLEQGDNIMQKWFAESRSLQIFGVALVYKHPGASQFHDTIIHFGTLKLPKTGCVMQGTCGEALEHMAIAGRGVLQHQIPSKTSCVCQHQSNSPYPFLFCRQWVCVVMAGSKNCSYRYLSDNLWNFLIFAEASSSVAQRMSQLEGATAQCQIFRRKPFSRKARCWSCRVVDAVPRLRGRSHVGDGDSKLKLCPREVLRT